jgi:hypothetical protein
LYGVESILLDRVGMFLFPFGMNGLRCFGRLEGVDRDF